MRKTQLERDLQHLRLMLNYAYEAQNIIPKAKKYGVPLDDEMVLMSLAMAIGQVGEQLAAGKISDELKERYEQFVPWKEIKGFRNIAYRDYGQIKAHLIMTIVNKDLPILIKNLEYLVGEIEKEVENQRGGQSK